MERNLRVLVSRKVIEDKIHGKGEGENQKSTGHKAGPGGSRVGKEVVKL